MSGRRLTLVERAQIEALWGEGLKIPAIAARIGRDRTTVWREVKRGHAYRGANLARAGVSHPGRHNKHNLDGLGGVYRWKYEHTSAHRKATERLARSRKRPKLCIGQGRRTGRPELAKVVRKCLKRRWSPQQIAHWLLLEYPNRPEMHVCHETIYQAIYLQGRGSLREGLAAEVALRSGRAQRRPRGRISAADRLRPWLRDCLISMRPAEVEDRAVPGHWEGDLVLGKGNKSAIITLVERTTRFVMLGALHGSHASQPVSEQLIALMAQVPEDLRRTLTWDRGSEMAKHADFTLATDCKVYFCDPHHPWQRGSNENTNGLLRQYFPKGKTDFDLISQAELDEVAAELNTRPRETLQWHTPAHQLEQLLVATES